MDAERFIVARPHGLINCLFERIGIDRGGIEVRHAKEKGNLFKEIPLDSMDTLIALDCANIIISREKIRYAPQSTNILV
jgi:hypothetical protein